MNNETLVFEKISIEEARAAHRGEASAKTMDDSEWLKQRLPLQPDELTLQPQTMTWLMSLPEAVRPLRLARQFPRIVNRLSIEWKRPQSCSKVFDDLTIDHRGTRKGFAIELAKEIADLKAYYDEAVCKRQKDSWSISI